MSLFVSPAIPALDSNANPVSGADWRFTLTGTTTPAEVYSDATLSTSLGSEVEADAGGKFPAIHLDPSVTYRARLFDAQGALIADYDPIDQPASANALRSTTGADMIGLLDGTSLSENILTVPRRLSYAKRSRVVTLRDARTMAADIHNQIVGYAKVAGTTGGAGKLEYLVTIDGMDATIGGAYPGLGGAGTYAWCKAAAEAAGGGIIIFYPEGQFDLIIRDNVQNRYEIGDDNITVIAPGRNATFWHVSLTGSSVVKNQNMITAYIEYAALAGPTSGDFVGDGTKAEVGMCSVFPQFATKQAWIGCSWVGGSDGAWDVASSALLPSSPVSYMTNQDFLFRWNDEVSLIGQTGDAAATTTAEARRLFVTMYNGIFDGCGQRQVKVLGLAMVDFCNVYTQAIPYKRDQPAPVEEYGSCYGLSVQGGGWALVRGNLFTTLDGVAREATKLIANPTSGVTGAIRVLDSAAEFGSTFATAGTVADPSYIADLPHTAVPVAGDARGAWIQDRWDVAGAAVNPAPRGFFAYDADSDAYPNQKTVVVRRVNGAFLPGREINTTPGIDEPLDPGPEAGASSEGRGYTRTIGFLEGKASNPAIGPLSLDLANPDSGFFAVQGNGGAATLKFVLRTDGNAIADGQEMTLVGTASAPVTIKSATSIAVTTVDITANTLTVPAHGMATGAFPVSFTSSGTLPAGMVSGQQYYVAVVDANTIKLATSYENATSGIAGSVVDLTSAGTGTHTALIGAFNLPGGRDVRLDSSAKAVKFRMHTGASSRFVPQGGTFETESGAYFPTITAVANCSAVALGKAQFARNGSVVTVSVKVTGTTTVSSTLTKVGIALPVASNLTDNGDLCGTCCTSNVPPASGFVLGDTTNDRAEANFISAGAGSFALFLSFQYEVK